MPASAFTRYTWRPGPLLFPNGGNACSVDGVFHGVSRRSIHHAKPWEAGKRAGSSHPTQVVRFDSVAGLDAEGKTPSTYDLLVNPAELAELEEAIEPAKNSHVGASFRPFGTESCWLAS
jgi:hypothetical protein